MSSEQPKNVIDFGGKTQDEIVFERIMEAIYDAGKGMPASRVAGVLEAVKLNIFKVAKRREHE